MGFYEEISEYYDYIFPVGESSLEFIKKAAGAPPKRILDIACGAGGHSIALSKAGYNVTATDLDAAMIEKARYKAAEQGLGLDFRQLDMRRIGDAAGTAYDLAFCIGNSIVHLGSRGEILKVLKQLRTMLPSGTLILQIINYDRIINSGVTELPPIINEELGLSFVRKYSYDSGTGYIDFNTALTVKNKEGIKTFNNSIKLLPLRSGELTALLGEAGFGGQILTGGFNDAPFDPGEAYMLVVRAH